MFQMLLYAGGVEGGFYLVTSSVVNWVLAEHSLTFACASELVLSMHFINVPGLRNSGPGHWQTLWEEQYPESFVRVQQHKWEEPEKEDWISSLADLVSLYRQEELVLVGHSVGCATILHAVQEWGWKLKGALLVGPSDVNHPDYPAYIRNFAPMPLAALNFPAVVVASDNDHVVSLQRATYFASCLGSKLVVCRQAGHFLPKNGFGEWPQGLKLLEKLQPAFKA